MKREQGRITRRGVGGLTATAMLGNAARPASAIEDEWPSRSITLVVPWAPGGSNDLAARLIAPALSDRIGRQIVVDNRAGAGGAVGMGQAARARPDGYSLLLSSASNHVFNHLVVRNQGYDPREAFTGIGLVNDVPLALAVWPGLGVTGIQDLVERSRTTPGGLGFGSSGVGSSAHLAGELFAMLTGAQLEHIPYRGGGPALTDLMSGTLPLAWLTLPAAMPQIATGGIRVLGIASEIRSALQPDLPTVQEQGLPGYAVRSWTGLFVPRGTPQSVVDRLAQELHFVSQEPRMREKLIEIGSEPIWMGPTETNNFIRSEFTRWAPVVQQAGLGK
jgi:tripartite-type tricarboxylate transporter receptor subunit TctC